MEISSGFDGILWALVRHQTPHFRRDMHLISPIFWKCDGMFPSHFVRSTLEMEHVKGFVRSRWSTSRPVGLGISWEFFTLTQTHTFFCNRLTFLLVWVFGKMADRQGSFGTISWSTIIRYHFLNTIYCMFKKWYDMVFGEGLSDLPYPEAPQQAWSCTCDLCPPLRRTSVFGWQNDVQNPKSHLDTWWFILHNR